MAKAPTAPKATDTTPATTPAKNGSSLNSVSLIGRLTSNVVPRTTPSGRPVANFRIAVAGRDQQVSYQSITAWGNLGNVCAAYLSKGRLVSVHGRLDSRDWTAADGAKRTSVSVTAFNVQFLDKKPAAAVGEVGV